MKYEKEIIAAFANIGRLPRDNQLEYIDKILFAFIDQGKKNIILKAPTGSGKSIIGAVVADVLADLDEPEDDLASFILMGTNILSTQYFETFNGHEDFVQIKGANNYPCTVLSDNTAGVKETAESCAMQLLKSAGVEDVIQQHCWNCEYLRLRNKKNTTRQLITNFSYFFVDRMFSDTLDRRKLTIWDEAHTINDAFVEHNAIYFSVKRLTDYAAEIVEHLSFPDPSTYNILKKIRDDLKVKKITEKNYQAYLLELHGAYKAIADNAKASADRSIKQYSKYTKFNRLYKKYFGLGCKIGDLLTYKYDHVFEFDEKEIAVSVKPIFVGTMFNTLINSKYNLFMSATINEQYVVDTLQLDKNETTFIQIPAIFPKENKKIVFLSPLYLNYKSLQEEKTKEQVRNLVEKVVIKHTELGESGIVLTPSFALNRLVCDRLIWSKDVEVIEHQSGKKLAAAVEQFKLSKVPTVLVSPSLFEGVDLAGEFSRYQIIVKSPFASLADKRVKFILEKYPEIYSFAALLKIIQGAGRSVRSKEDWAVTYILDQAAVRLWNSPQNVWKDEFSVMYSSFL